MQTPDEQRRLAKYRRTSKRTKAEIKLAEILDTLGVRYLQQKGFMSGIRTFVIADFYIPKPHKLVIEVDGEYHKAHQGYDEWKDNYYKSRGFKVLRLSNEVVLNSSEDVYSTIKSRLNIT